MEGSHLFSELINLLIYSTNIGGDPYYLQGTVVGPLDTDKTDMMHLTGWVDMKICKYWVRREETLKDKVVSSKEKSKLLEKY